MGCNVGLKGKGKEVDKCFRNVELKAIKTIEQPTLDQGNIKSTKTLTQLKYSQN